MAPAAAVTASSIRLKTGNAVSTIVNCMGATCAGTLELTKTVTTKIQIGHTKKYRVRATVLNLGQTRYAVRAGESRGFAVHLNATGLKLVRTGKSRRYSCELVMKTSTGTFREMISFVRP